MTCVVRLDGRRVPLPDSTLAVDAGGASAGVSRVGALMVATDPNARTLRRETSGAFRVCGYDGALLREPAAPGAPPTPPPPLRPPVALDVNELGALPLGRAVFVDAGDGVWRIGRLVRNASRVLLSELDGVSGGSASLGRRVSTVAFAALSGPVGRTLFEQPPDVTRAVCTFETVLEDGRTKFAGVATKFHGTPLVTLGSLADLQPAGAVLLIEGDDPADGSTEPPADARFYGYHPSFRRAADAVPNV